MMFGCCRPNGTGIDGLLTERDFETEEQNENTGDARTES